MTNLCINNDRNNNKQRELVHRRLKNNKNHQVNLYHRETQRIWFLSFVIAETWP
jgi:hypothetical protein